MDPTLRNNNSMRSVASTDTTQNHSFWKAVQEKRGSEDDLDSLAGSFQSAALDNPEVFLDLVDKIIEQQEKHAREGPINENHPLHEKLIHLKKRASNQRSSLHDSFDSEKFTITSEYLGSANGDCESLESEVEKAAKALRMVRLKFSHTPASPMGSHERNQKQGSELEKEQFSDCVITASESSCHSNLTFSTPPETLSGSSEMVRASEMVRVLKQHVQHAKAETLKDGAEAVTESSKRTVTKKKRASIETVDSTTKNQRVHSDRNAKATVDGGASGLEYHTTISATTENSVEIRRREGIAVQTMLENYSSANSGPDNCARNGDKTSRAVAKASSAAKNPDSTVDHKNGSDRTASSGAASLSKVSRSRITEDTVTESDSKASKDGANPSKAAACLKEINEKGVSDGDASPRNRSTTRSEHSPSKNSMSDKTAQSSFPNSPKSIELVQETGTNHPRKSPRSRETEDSTISDGDSIARTRRSSRKKDGPSQTLPNPASPANEKDRSTGEKKKSLKSSEAVEPPGRNLAEESERNMKAGPDSLENRPGSSQPILLTTSKVESCQEPETTTTELGGEKTFETSLADSPKRDPKERQQKASNDITEKTKTKMGKRLSRRGGSISTGDSSESDGEISLESPRKKNQEHSMLVSAPEGVSKQEHSHPALLIVEPRTPKMRLAVSKLPPRSPAVKKTSEKESSFTQMDSKSNHNPRDGYEQDGSQAAREINSELQTLEPRSSDSSSAGWEEKSMLSSTPSSPKAKKSGNSKKAAPSKRASKRALNAPDASNGLKEAQSNVTSPSSASPSRTSTLLQRQTKKEGRFALFGKRKVRQPTAVKISMSEDEESVEVVDVISKDRTKVSSVKTLGRRLGLKMLSGRSQSVPRTVRFTEEQSDRGSVRSPTSVGSEPAFTNSSSKTQKAGHDFNLERSLLDPREQKMTIQDDLSEISGFPSVDGTKKRRHRIGLKMFSRRSGSKERSNEEMVDGVADDASLQSSSMSLDSGTFEQSSTSLKLPQYEKPGPSPTLSIQPSLDGSVVMFRVRSQANKPKSFGRQGSARNSEAHIEADDYGDEFYPVEITDDLVLADQMGIVLNAPKARCEDSVTTKLPVESSAESREDKFTKMISDMPATSKKLVEVVGRNLSRELSDLDLSIIPEASRQLVNVIALNLQQGTGDMVRNDRETKQLRAEKSQTVKQEKNVAFAEKKTNSPRNAKLLQKRGGDQGDDKLADVRTGDSTLLKAQESPRGKLGEKRNHDMENVQQREEDRGDDKSPEKIPYRDTFVEGMISYSFDGDSSHGGEEGSSASVTDDDDSEEKSEKESDEDKNSTWFTGLFPEQEEEQTYASHTFESTQCESRTFESAQYESRTFESARFASQTFESAQYESQTFESGQTEGSSESQE